MSRPLGQHINKDNLIEDLADHLTEGVDLKTLIQMYYDDQVGYMSGMEDEELLKWAMDYLGLTREEVLKEYTNE